MDNFLKLFFGHFPLFASAIRNIIMQL